MIILFFIIGMAIGIGGCVALDIAEASGYVGFALGIACMLLYGKISSLDTEKSKKVLKIIGCVGGALLLAVIIYAFSSCGEAGGKAGSGKCTICNKSASHTFQGSDYCDRHYKDAIEWAVDNVND